jgi:hypothetical protein
VRALLFLLLLLPATAAAQLRSLDPAARERAARAAGERGDKAAIPALIELLRDEHAAVRLEAARSLGWLRARPALRDLQVLAQTDFDEPVRRAAAEAVSRIDSREFAAKLGTADLPPVRPAPPQTPSPPVFRRPLVVLSGSGLFNALRASDAGGAQVGVGLRWRFLDVHWSLGFPSLSLFWQLRVSLVETQRFVPYLTAGLAVAFNNGTDRAGTLAAAGGLGARLRLYGPLHLFAEVLANVMLLDAEPPRPGLDRRSLSVPVIAGLSVEL